MKCKYHKKCKWYMEDSHTCNINGGQYYEDSDAGCKVKIERENYE